MEGNKGFGRCSGSGGIKIGDWCIQVSGGKHFTVQAELTYQAAKRVFFSGKSSTRKCYTWYGLGIPGG